MRDDNVYEDYDAIYAWQEWHETFQCPAGHGQMAYWEGIVDQDEQGNNIDGCNHYCPVCGYATEIESL